MTSLTCPIIRTIIKKGVFSEQKWQFLRIFRLISQLGVTCRSKKIFKLFVILMFNTVWNIKAISFYKRPQNSFKWWLEISIFWNIGQLWPQFSGLRSADIKKLLLNDLKVWSFNSLKIQSVFDLLLWFRRFKHFKLWPILPIFGDILV